MLLQLLDRYRDSLMASPRSRDHQFRPMDLATVRERLTLEALAQRQRSAAPWHAGPDANRYNGRLAPDLSTWLIDAASVAFRDLRGGKRLAISGQLYYPPSGYMGWHHNGNLPGRRIYCNWAADPDASYFCWLEGTRLVRDWDAAGWNFRTFVVGGEPPFWHAVYSETHRVSLGFRVVI